MTKARQSLSADVTFGLLFCSPNHDLQLALKEARELCSGAAWLGCHGAGEFTELGLSHGGVAVLLYSSSELMCAPVFADNIRDPEVAARTLTKDFTSLQLEARTRGLGLSSTLLLLDGLVGTGDQLVSSVQRETRMFQSIIGGAAGDDGQFSKAWVGVNSCSGTGAAAALQLFHGQPWGVGIGHGLEPQTPPMTVTRASGNVVYEIEGRPAFAAYQDYAAQRGLDLRPEDQRFLLENELGVLLLNRLHHARAPVRVGRDGELHLVAQIAEGSQVVILNGQPERMVAGCRAACQEAREALNGLTPSAIVVFDCVCRGAILGEDFASEIAAVASVFPDTPTLGLLTYGEIARTGGRLDGWHNSTCVVLALP